MYIDPLIYFFLFVLGTIVGSFLNVVILRLNTGLPIVKGRSQCFVCSEPLRWCELVPVLSFIILRGKCMHCKTRISWQYPLVEIITGVLFVATVYVHGFSQYTLYQLCFMALLVIIAMYDLRHKIIPDSVSYLFAALGLIMCLHMLLYTGGHGIVDLFAGPVLAIPFAFLWLISRGRWIGLGDAKLVLGMGFMLGFVGGVSAIVLAFWIGAAWSVLLLLFSRGRVGMKSEIPFGPFLVLGTLLIFFFGWDVLGLAALSPLFVL